MTEHQTILMTAWMKTVMVFRIGLKGLAIEIMTVSLTSKIQTVITMASQIMTNPMPRVEIAMVTVLMIPTMSIRPVVLMVMMMGLMMMCFP